MLMLFVQVLSEKDHELAANAEYNFDHPDAFDFDLLGTTLQRLKEGKNVEVPIYNFATHRREKHQVLLFEHRVLPAPLFKLKFFLY